MSLQKRRRQMVMVSLERMVLLILTASTLSVGAEVRAAQPACTVTGTIYRDYNDNGVRDQLEPVQGQITVTAYNAQGQVVGTTTANAQGAYNLNLAAVPANDEVRVEFTRLPTYLHSARFGADSNTTVTFVTCNGAVTLDFGASNPGQYCHTVDPTLGTSCYTNEDQLRGAGANQPAFVTFPYTATGDDPHDVQAVARQIGTTWGLGYHRNSAAFFVASFLKRHGGFGPDATGVNTTTGAIYRIDPSAPAAARVSLFMDLSALGFNTGADPHPRNPGDCPSPRVRPDCWQYDTNSFNSVGKLSLGDLDISEDDLKIYVINLNTRELLTIPIGLTGVAPAAGAVRRYPLTLSTLPGIAATCPNYSDVRPFGLGMNDGRVYVGLVCSAESTQQRANMRAYVYSMDELNPGLGFRQEIAFPLDYPRQCLDLSPNCTDRNADWNPWSPTWPAPDLDPNGASVQIYSEPWLTDIVFDNGAMILGFRDRMGDRTGNFQANPLDLNDPDLYLGIAGGDVLRACRNVTTGVWELENDGSCGGVTTPGAAHDQQGPGTGEFYYDDMNNPTGTGQPLHDEIVLGGLVDIPGSDRFAATVFDPLCVGCATNELFDGGVAWFYNSGPNVGGRAQSYRIFDGEFADIIGTFGKSNGLGDLEAVCAPPPLEIGNRVWEDLDTNGVQDPNEVKLANVRLQLYMDTNRDGVVDLLVGQTQTDANGEYYFNESNVFSGAVNGVPNTPRPGINFVDINGNGVRDSFEPVGLIPNTVYEVRLDDPANYDPGGPLENYYITPNDTATRADGFDDIRDSDGTNPAPLTLVSATNYPVKRLQTRAAGDNDHTYDFGFSLVPPPVVNAVQPAVSVQGGVTISKTVDKPFAQPGDAITWTVTVTNPNNVPVTNTVVEDPVPGELEILSAQATRGNVEVNGQTVRLSIDILGPGESAVLTIQTRIRASVKTPFVIVNQVGDARAQVLSAQRLPNTGESLWLIVIPMVLAVGLGIAAAYGLWRRRQPARK